ncbi:Ubiquitin-conjugating enzyme E2 pex4 [Phytophthora citrophthora]|uniref:Ubiquitin-conjugating enzyme E2 pex4 n=1 Tax=Phytophthora citrophthora TaxID=4793 RepID=A0AAD9GB71_9STRA|nr:Ubiquitin-conjugating enzyme E2 pex4 [Phytophthora citrophthora]
MNTNVKRLRKELQELKKNPEEDIVLYPEEDTIMRWKAFIRGPKDTPFEDRCFELAIHTTPLYPMEPPKMKFVTKIFHPNVHFKVSSMTLHFLRNCNNLRTFWILATCQSLQDGSICLDILKREWSPAWTLRAACLAVISLLSDPAADSPLNCDAGNMIRAGDMLAYNTMAEMYKKEYGLLELPKDPF